MSQVSGARFSLGNALTHVPGALPDALAKFEAALLIRPDFQPARIRGTGARRFEMIAWRRLLVKPG